MKHIPLSRGKAFALCSPKDYDYLMQWKWSYSHTNGYALRYFTDENDSRKSVFMHRVVMTRMLGSLIPAGYQVDHIFQGKEHRINNQRENLRLATRSENQWHKAVPINSKTGYKGVSYHQGKFDSYLRIYGKRLYLGRFIDALDAALMYDAASRALFKEFSHENFPDVPTPPEMQERVLAIVAQHEAWLFQQ
jgi:hypothetical protein